MAPADDLEQLLGVRAEHRDEDELLLARRETLRLLPDVLRGHGILRELPGRREELDGTLDRRVDRLGRLAVAALDELAELVDDGAVAPRLEHVQKRLRGEDLADRRGERRPAGLGADASDLLEHLEQTIGGGVRAQVHLESCDEARREVVLGGADGDPRRDVRDRLVADPLVDDVRRVPELRDLEPGRLSETLERLRDATLPRRGGASARADRPRSR